MILINHLAGTFLLNDICFDICIIDISLRWLLPFESHLIYVLKLVPHSPELVAELLSLLVMLLLRCSL
jgi:hypothetical protein